MFRIVHKKSVHDFDIASVGVKENTGYSVLLLMGCCAGAEEQQERQRQQWCQAARAAWHPVWFSHRRCQTRLHPHHRWRVQS